MKKLLTFCVMLAGIVTCSAQTVIDTFNVGPYIVDYKGQGDVKYRLRDNINLYEFFELKMDTTVMVYNTPAIPVKGAFQLSAVLGANLYTTKEFGVEGVWKQNIGKNVYFNGGLSVLFDYTDDNSGDRKRTTFELGVPLQIELSNLSRQKSSLYGLFGLYPTFYSTLKADNDIKKSGFMLAPAIEFGGNIPAGKSILRIGAYVKYKINCTTSDYDVYKESIGHTFIGGKISVVF